MKYNFEDWLFWVKEIWYEPFMYWCTEDEYNNMRKEYNDYKG